MMNLEGIGYDLMKVLSWCLSGATEKNHENVSFSIADDLTEI
jgi:hypothetical protein